MTHENARNREKTSATEAFPNSTPGTGHDDIKDAESVEAVSSYIGTPYDDAFRTMTNDCADLLIPLINEVFGTDYPADSEVIFGKNEHYINQLDGELEKRITDSSFRIIRKHGESDGRYLVECQSKPDHTIIVRLFEYATQIALDDNVIIGNKMIVEVPRAAVLYLRSARNTPEKLTIEMILPEGKASFDIPAIKMSSYNLDDLFNKNLYFLIPFFLFNRENRFKNCDEDAEKLDELIAEVSRLITRLQDAMESDKISAYQRQIILEMTRLVSNTLTKKYKKVKKGVEKAMGGKVIETEASRIYKACKKEDAIAMLKDGQKPENIARILRISVEYVYKLAESESVQMGDKAIETEAGRIYKDSRKEYAIAMLEDGLDPERVARILRISAKNLYELIEAEGVQMA